MRITIEILIATLLASYCFILKQENRAYESVYSNLDGGYKEFVSKSVNGKHLYELINPHSAGVFKVGNVSMACAILNQKIPDRLK